uniref:Uncharacterized protein n=1 Tax=Anguilla anguilla TaxID=7936 RepID=A0A0E9VV39_ANGAN
MLICHSCILQ